MPVRRTAGASRKVHSSETVFKCDCNMNSWEGETPTEPISSRFFDLTARQEPRPPNLKAASQFVGGLIGSRTGQRVDAQNEISMLRAKHS